MVLTPRRWLLALLVTAAMTAVAYLPPADIADSSRWSPYTRASYRETTRTRLAFAAERWVALSERDALSKSPATSEVPALIVRGGLRADVSQAVDSLIRNFWRRAPRADSSIRLRVVASADAETGFPSDLWTAAEAPEVLLPELTDSRTCLVILPGIFQHGMAEPVQQGWWRNNLRRQVGLAVAPCVLRAALGKPGPEIARWLGARGYDLGGSIGWAVGGNPGVEYESSWFDGLQLDQTGMPQLMQRIIGALPEAYQSTVAARCAGGVAGQCAGLITAVPGLRRESGPTIRMRTLGQQRANGLPSDASSFLSDLILERGLEPFRRFWTSPLPVEAAFAQAYGESLDDWTHAWVKRRVGTVELGAPLHPLGVLAGLLAGVLVVGITAVAARSREMS